MKDKNKAKNEVADALVMVLQLGINILVPIFLCMLAGHFLGRIIGSDNDWFTIGGILIGIVAAFNGAYRSFKKYLKNVESPGERARRLEEEEKANSEVEHD